MGKHERNSSGDGPKLSFNFGSDKLELRPDNAELYTYSDLPDADHTLLHRDGRNPLIIFRNKFSNFDSVSYFMESNGYRVVNGTYPNPQIYDLYVKVYGEQDIPPFDDITPRNERKIQFAKWLLDREIVTADDFE